jgi:hypothetical protein
MPPSYQQNGIDRDTLNFINGTRGIENHTSFRPATARQLESNDVE